MEELLKESLREEEKLLWSGRPEPFEPLDKTHKSPFIRSGIITALVTIAICVAYVILAGINNAPLKPAVLVIVAACGIFIILRCSDIILNSVLSFLKNLSCRIE